MAHFGPTFATILALALAGTHSSAGQAPVRDARRFRSGVELTSITATVTDRDGHPVAGLAPEAFEVYEDGERQKITQFARERVPFEPQLVSGISWVFPDNPLGAQMERTLAAGYLRGAVLWHVACALYLVEETDELSFLTLDERQRAVVQRLGFRA